MTWTRRRVLKTSGAAAAAPVLPGCTTGTSWSAPDCTLDEVVQSFFAEPYDAFVPLARWLGEGLGESELYAAAMNAAARWVWPGDDMHAAMVVRACQLLGARLAEPERWVPLFWAWDQVHGAAGSDDLAPHDARGTSSTDDAQAGLEESWDRWDPAAADAYAAELYAVGGRPAQSWPSHAQEPERRQRRRGQANSRELQTHTTSSNPESRAWTIGIAGSADSRGLTP